MSPCGILRFTNIMSSSCRVPEADSTKMIRHCAMELNQDQRLKRQIGTARTLFEHCRNAFEQQPELLPLLSAYSAAIGGTQMLMRRLKVTAACTDCAKQGAGSCCFEGIESGYDSVLLLINLLMGCDIPDSREVPGSCFFVGERGCKLQARYYYCLHYLCPALQAALGPDAISELLSILGKELAAGWELERALHRFFTKNQQESGVRGEAGFC
jgi:hypothetical protein